MIHRILDAMGVAHPWRVSPFQNEEDGENYTVWRLDYPDKSIVLKKAKGKEVDMFHRFLFKSRAYAPTFFASAKVDGAEYLLMEYIPGHDLKKANRQDLILALDALIAMQSEYWMAEDASDSFQKCLDSRVNRKKFLQNDQLEQAYDAYLAEFTSIPRTLCHDDLLPFNVIVSTDRAVLIDWEVAGMLPYPTSLARLVAHGEEDENAFFHLKQEDRAFAIDYYFESFVKKKGISREAFDRSLALCLLYEYCEWVYVGNKYGNQESERFRNYSHKALQQAVLLGF